MRYLDASFVRSGVTHGVAVSRTGTDGTVRYYNWANATWGTTAVKFSLQPSVTYIVKFETNTSGQFRYVVCSQSGSPLVNGTTLWTSFSTVYNDAANNYWPYVGDAFADAYSGTVEITSVSGPVPATSTPLRHHSRLPCRSPRPRTAPRVTGVVDIAATAADTGGSGLARVDFRVDGVLVASDSLGSLRDHLERERCDAGRTHDTGDRGGRRRQFDLGIGLGDGAPAARYDAAYRGDHRSAKRSQRLRLGSSGGECGGHGRLGCRQGGVQGRWRPGRLGRECPVQRDVGRRGRCAGLATRSRRPHSTARGTRIRPPSR